MIATLRAWPRRRWLAAAVAFPLTTGLLAAAGWTGLPGGAGQPGVGTLWWIWPWLALTGAFAALVLASYLAGPGAGRLIEIGCSPCAAASALAVGGAVMAHASAPGSPFLAALATGLTVVAVRQRLTDAAACPASPPPPGGPPAG